MYNIFTIGVLEQSGAYGKHISYSRSASNVPRWHSHTSPSYSSSGTKRVIASYYRRRGT